MADNILEVRGLKKYFDTPKGKLQAVDDVSFKIEKGNLASFLIQLLIFIVITAVVGVAIGLLSAIPILGIIFWIVGALMEIYTIVGIVLCILNFLGVELAK